MNPGSSERAGDRDASEGRALCPKTPNPFASQRSWLLAAVTSALRFSQPTKAGPGTRTGVGGSSTEAGGVGVAQGNAHLLTQSEGAGRGAAGEPGVCCLPVSASLNPLGPWPRLSVCTCFLSRGGYMSLRQHPTPRPPASLRLTDHIPGLALPGTPGPA